MYKGILTLVLMVGSIWAGQYSTSFPNAENPLLESGNWTEGMVTGLVWSNCVSVSGMVFGTANPAGPNYHDATAILTGSWGATQTVSAVVKMLATNANDFQEVELRLRSTLTANNSTGYEVLFSVNPADGFGNYCQIVRWNGNVGDFTGPIGSATAHVHDGQTVKATIVGNLITGYIDGASIMTATDNTYTTGNPGIGFYYQYSSGGADTTNYGFSSFSATDGITNSPVGVIKRLGTGSLGSATY